VIQQPKACIAGWFLQGLLPSCAIDHAYHFSAKPDQDAPLQGLDQDAQNQRWSFFETLPGMR